MQCKMSSHLIREVFVEIPDVRWQDLGGLALVRERHC